MMKRKGAPVPSFTYDFPYASRKLPIFADNVSYGGDVSGRLFERGLCLPSGSSLTDEDQDRVVATILSARSA